MPVYFTAYFIGWMATATIRLVIAAVVVVGVVGALQAVRERRRKHGAARKKPKPTFYDQVMQEMTQFDEAVERGLKRSAERALAAADLTAEVWHEVPETEPANAVEEPIAEELPEAPLPQRGFARALAAAAAAGGRPTERPQRIPQTEQPVAVGNPPAEEQRAVPQKPRARAAAAGSSATVETSSVIPPSWVGSDRP
jgi:hypothetical protein